MRFWVRRQQQLPSLEVQEQAQGFDTLAFIKAMLPGVLLEELLFMELEALLLQRAHGDVWADHLAL